MDSPAAPAFIAPSIIFMVWVSVCFEPPAITTGTGHPRTTSAKDSGLPVKSLIKIEYAGSSDGKPGSEIVVNTEEILSLYSYNQPVEIVPPIDALDSPHFPESDGLTTILDVYAPI